MGHAVARAVTLRNAFTQPRADPDESAWTALGEGRVQPNDSSSEEDRLIGDYETDLTP